MEVASDMNELCLVSDRNHRRYTLPEKVVEEFNSRPPEKRMATLGWPRIDQKKEELQCGSIDVLQDICGRVNVHVAIDPNLQCGKELKALIEGGKSIVCGLGGYGHCEGEIAVMDSIEYVAISEPQDVPR
jgi:hypothetical protein